MALVPLMPYFIINVNMCEVRRDHKYSTAPGITTEMNVSFPMTYASAPTHTNTRTHTRMAKALVHPPLLEHLTEWHHLFPVGKVIDENVTSPVGIFGHKCSLEQFHLSRYIKSKMYFLREA